MRRTRLNSRADEGVILRYSLLRQTFNLGLLSGKLPSLRKQATVVPIFRKGSSAVVSNYKPVLILNDFLRNFGSIIHDHVYFYFKCKLHPSQHVYIKSESTVTNLVT
jgi:hypothetical protein